MHRQLATCTRLLGRQTAQLSSHMPAACAIFAAFCTSVAGYTFAAGKKISHYDEPPSGLSAVQLAVLCDATPGCAGFSSDGFLHSSISSQLEPWPNPGPCDGLFVKAAPDGAPDCSQVSGGALYCSYCLADGQRLTCPAGGTVTCKVRRGACWVPRIPAQAGGALLG